MSIQMTAEKQTSPGHASQELPAIVPVKQEPDALPSSSEGTPFDAPKVRNDVTIHKVSGNLIFQLLLRTYGLTLL